MKFTKTPSAAAIVAGASFIASAGHIVSVVDETNPIWFALAYPIGIDGLIYVGIRAMQGKRFLAGAVALLIGAIYSLAFNAHAEGALTMPALMIASSMPVAMFAAFLIEHSGEKAEEIEAPAPAPAPVHVPATVPAPVKIAAKPTRPAITDGRKGSGRTAAWDVEKAVRLLADGRTNEEIASTVGTNTKAIQRTKRAGRMIEDGMADAEIATTVGVSVAHVARIRAAK